MKDWQLDAMYEAESDKIWEDQNKDRSLIEVIDYMQYAMNYSEDMARNLGEAIEAAKGTVYEARIASVFEDLERLQDDLTSLKARMEEARKSA